MRPTSPTILLVDDESLIRWSIGQHLSQQGYLVREASTGAEARRALEVGGGPDLVLLDLRLPDSDGLGLLGDIRRARPNCRVIVLSAHATPETARRALELGASAVAHKPFDLELVQRLVEQALDGWKDRAGTRDSA